VADIWEHLRPAHKLVLHTSIFCLKYTVLHRVYLSSSGGSDHGLLIILTHKLRVWLIPVSIAPSSFTFSSSTNPARHGALVYVYPRVSESLSLCVFFMFSLDLDVFCSGTSLLAEES
jgi:hypothetical protein